MACNAILLKSPRHLIASKEKFKDTILIAAVEYVDRIYVI